MFALFKPRRDRGEAAFTSLMGEVAAELAEAEVLSQQVARLALEGQRNRDRWYAKNKPAIRALLKAGYEKLADGHAAALADVEFSDGKAQQRLGAINARLAHGQSVLLDQAEARFGIWPVKMARMELGCKDPRQCQFFL